MAKEPEKGNWRPIPAAVGDEGRVDCLELHEGGIEPHGIVLNEDGVSKKVHQFYFVKFWPYKDPEEHSKFEWARKQSEELDQQKKILIDDKRQEMVSPRVWVTHGSNNLANEEQLSTEIPNVQQKDINSSFLGREINNRAYFWYSMSRNKEQFVQILEGVMQIEERQQKAMADAASNGNIWNPLSSKKAIDEQLLNKIPEILRPECCEVMAEIKCLEDELKAVDKEMNDLSKTFQGLIQRKQEAYEFLLSTINQCEEAKANYYEYLSLLSNARDLARKKDVAALEELSRRQVDKFMSRWNSSQAFRVSYEKAILPSLDNRELGRDGLVRNDDEGPILLKDSAHVNGDTEANKLLIIRSVSSLLALFIVFDIRNNM
ncbi:Proton pump interactor 1-like protein [Theobroma cacao]|uniref:Proton pump interactor 1-like protein n=1 Tax=Theobroma cacao TaxID=3641 RepID=A0A061FBZ7_THECC|nr:Proton pump interactor 1-like protein [Theobroma cacao]